MEGLTNGKSRVKGVLAMNFRLIAAFALPSLFLCNIGTAQKRTSNVPYVENGHERQVLDMHRLNEVRQAREHREEESSEAGSNDDDSCHQLAVTRAMAS